VSFYKSFRFLTCEAEAQALELRSLEMLLATNLIQQLTPNEAYLLRQYLDKREPSHLRQKIRIYRELKLPCDSGINNVVLTGVQGRDQPLLICHTINQFCATGTSEEFVLIASIFVLYFLIM
jgi:hypothetical protein